MNPVDHDQILNSIQQKFEYLSWSQNRSLTITKFYKHETQDLRLRIRPERILHTNFPDSLSNLPQLRWYTTSLYFAYKFTRLPIKSAPTEKIYQKHIRCIQSSQTPYQICPNWDGIPQAYMLHTIFPDSLSNLPQLRWYTISIHVAYKFPSFPIKFAPTGYTTSIHVAYKFPRFPINLPQRRDLGLRFQAEGVYRINF